MYLPYLRGRQYELIALRELVEKKVLSDKIIPVIEPVRLSTTLVKTMELYGRENRLIAFITNPEVGNFVDEKNEENNKKLAKDLNDSLQNNNVISMYLLKANSDLSESSVTSGKKVGTICVDSDSIAIYQKYFAQMAVTYNLMPDGSVYRSKVETNRVLLADRFNKRPKNSDYKVNDDEPFSEDHLYYNSDGYIGFADYSIVGSEYSETGFAPYAVAIHIVYFADDNSLRVRHFVSDSNDDIKDPPKKFQEALVKLIKWNEEKKLDTVAMREFQKLYDREAYPGLGTVKKLCIMHHLELIGDYLDKE